MPRAENLHDGKREFEERPFSKPYGKKTFHHGLRPGASYMALILAFGIALAGFFAGYFYYMAKFNANTVVVKGLSEMNVRADLAIWEMKYVVTGNDVIAAQKEISGQTAVIKDFLLNNGFKEDEITVGRLETNDLNANPYRGNYENNLRFILNQTITVKSQNVDLVADVLNKSGDLVAKGIIFSSEYGSPVSYLFTKLNDIKPKMLMAATQNARDAAAQFAESSKSKVGHIKYANQGMFTILPQEETSSATESQQINKKVRVVSTIEYWLK